jgi:DNA-binding transcriptional ArsR family regulator
MKTTIDKIVLHQNKTDVTLVYDHLHKIVLHLRAINHPVRQNIINLLTAEGAMSVTQIYLRLRIDQSVTSQHLTMLYRAGIVDRERTGKSIYYSLDVKRLGELSQLIDSVNTPHFA